MHNPFSIYLIRGVMCIIDKSFPVIFLRHGSLTCSVGIPDNPVRVQCSTKYKWGYLGNWACCYRCNHPSSYTCHPRHNHCNNCIGRKSSRAGTANDEIHDEIPDVTKRQDLQQVTDIVLTDSNPATSHLQRDGADAELCVCSYTYSSGAQRSQGRHLPTGGIQLIHQTMLSCNDSVVFLGFFANDDKNCH